MITGPEVIAAREMLGWSVSLLAHQSRLSVQQVQQAEGEALSLSDLGVLTRLEATLEAAGVEFTDSEPSVRMKKVEG